MSPGSASPSNRRRIAPRLLLALGTALVALALGELGLRLVQRARGVPYGAARARTWLEEIASRARDTIPMPGGRENDPTAKGDVWGVPHPFVGWETNFGSEMLARDMERMRRGPGEPLRVLVLGGSVAAIFYDLGAPHLRRLLSADPALAGRKLEFRCYARGAYKQPQLLEYLALMLSLELEPDFVLEIDGFNEVALGSANFAAGTHPIWPSRIQWLPLVSTFGARPELAQDYVDLRAAQEELVRACSAGASSPLLASALYGEWKLARVRRAEQRFRTSSETYAAVLKDLAPPELRGPHLPRGPMDGLIRVVRNWRESSRLMQLLCAARGIGYLHVLQPTLHDPGAKPITDEEREKGKIQEAWLFGVEQGYPMLRQAGAELAREGTSFLDLSRLFADVHETLYYDLCHFTEPGNARMADAIAPAMLIQLRAAREDSEAR